MARELTFHAWWRPGLSGLLGDTDPAALPARAVAEIPLTLHRRPPDADPTVAGEDVAVALLAGPGDVDGLQPGAVRHRAPAPDVADAEPGMCAYVDFADPGLPWRYTPVVNPSTQAGTGLRPWLALLVGTDDELELHDGEVAIAREVLDAHPLDAAAGWAHVQEADGTVLSRLLSPRALAADATHVAVLVPTFRVEDGLAIDAWTLGATGGARLQCYEHWQFRTGPAGDFRTLASRLVPRPAGALGAAPVAYDRLPSMPRMIVRGALTGPDAPDDAPDADVLDDLDGLRTAGTDEDGRPLVGLPIHGAPWDAEQQLWGEQLNADPRHRVAAGLGAALGRDAVSELVDAVQEQAAGLDEADQRVRALGLGVAAGGAVFDRRLPVDDRRCLAVLGPALRRIITDTGSLAHLATDEDRPLPTGWFSTALRRATRRGPARTALASPAASDSAELWDAVNTCPPPRQRTAPGLPEVIAARVHDADGELPSGRVTLEGLAALLELLAEQSRDPALVGRLRQRLAELEERGGPLPLDALLDLVQQRPPPDLKTLVAALEDLARGRIDAPDGIDDRLDALITAVRPTRAPAEDCRPVDVEVLARATRDALDPRSPMALARRQVLGPIEGLELDIALRPLELCPEVDVAVWRLLRDADPRWLLPGLGTVPDDSVLAVGTNPAFVDAVLAGLNTELLAQLRWRDLPIRAGCTPVKTFWQRVDPSAAQGAGARLDDIAGLVTWPGDTGLGDPAHRPDALTGEDLVLVVRGQLLLRYPTTLVYLVPDDDGTPDTDAPAEQVDLPTFRGALGDGAVLVGFAGRQPDDLLDRWVVFEESPSGLRFRNDVIPSGDDGATAASERLAQPVRVLIPGTALSEGGTA